MVLAGMQRRTPFKTVLGICRDSVVFASALPGGTLRKLRALTPTCYFKSHGTALNLLIQSKLNR